MVLKPWAVFMSVLGALDRVLNYGLIKIIILLSYSTLLLESLKEKMTGNGKQI